MYKNTPLLTGNVLTKKKNIIKFRCRTRPPLAGTHVGSNSQHSSTTLVICPYVQNSDKLNAVEIICFRSISKLLSAFMVICINRGVE